jgi:WD repeat-containing protein 11
MFLLACHEIYLQFTTESESTDDTLGSEPVPGQIQKLHFPSKNVDDEELIAVSEVFGQYQKKLIHLCMDTEPASDWSDPWTVGCCHLSCGPWSILVPVIISI